MNTFQIKATYTGFFFLFIFLSGFWLSRIGKPYSMLLFNVHKFIGLGTFIFLVRTVYLAHKATPFATSQITWMVITVLLFVTTGIVGGLVSTDLELPLGISSVHKIFPYLTLLSSTTTIYFLFFQKG